MPNTTNFNWSTPADTDLVKDGAAAIRTLGNSIDTSFVDLKGGTTGQVLSKATGTDLDFTWVDKGVTGKNYLLNGGFAIAQRGIAFAAGANNDDAYTLDRWYILSDTNDVIDVTQDTTTVPTNGQFAIALDVETANKKFGIAQILENKDCLGLIGNTVTFSFKAKVSATTKLDNVKAAIISWSGAADSVTSDVVSAWNAEGTNPTLAANLTYENSPVNLNLTTSYATYSVSAAIDTASTKNIIVFIWSDVTDTTAGDFLYISESKLELGSTATAFTYAGSSIADELSLCEYYYQKSYRQGVNPGTATELGRFMQSCGANNSWLAFSPKFNRNMRAAPTVTVYDDAGTSGKVTTIDASTVETNNFSATPDYIGTNQFGLFLNISKAGIACQWTAEAEL